MSRQLEYHAQQLLALARSTSVRIPYDCAVTVIVHRRPDAGAPLTDWSLVTTLDLERDAEAPGEVVRVLTAAAASTS